jgi:membrane-bound serine protease (ClpP class)
MIAALVVLLVVLGMGLLAVEIFVIPGFGLIGILGIALFAGAGILAFSSLTSEWAVAALAAGAAVGGALAWMLPRSAPGRAFILDDTVRGARAGDATLTALVGAEGVAVTPLRPSGSARFDGRVVDVISDGRYVDASAPVRVVRVDGSRVLIEPVSPG